MAWSDWQDPWAMPIPVDPVNWPFQSRDQRDPTTTPADLAAAQAMANSLRDSIASGTYLTAGSRKWLLSDSSGSPIFRAGYAGGDLDATGHDGEIVSDLPTPLEALTVDVDYSAAPDWSSPTTLRPNAYVEYEDTTTSFSGWDALDVQVGLGVVWNESELPLPALLGFSFWATTPQTGQEIDDPTKAWLAYEDGTVLTHYDFPLRPLPDPGATIVDTAHVDLATWTDPTLALVWMPRVLDPAADVPISPTGLAWELDIFPENPAGVGAVDPVLPTATARYTSPRWRYWTGSPLRTIGDHFRSVGGADVKSLIPGVGWVKVRPGT